MSCRCAERRALLRESGRALLRADAVTAARGAHDFARSLGADARAVLAALAPTRQPASSGLSARPRR